MAEQTPTARTLNYGLTGDVMDRVAAASAATSQVKLEKAKVGMAVTEGITRQVGAYAGAVISGAAKSKALNEAYTKKRDELFETADARNSFGTPAGMENYKAALLPKQEEFQEAVRKGDKATQERLMLELGEDEKYLTSLRDNHADIQANRENKNLIEDTNIVSNGNQLALAALYSGDASVEYSRAEDGSMSRVVPAGDDIVSELTRIETTYGVNYENDGETVIPGHNKPGSWVQGRQNEYIDRLLNGDEIGEYAFYNASGGIIVKNADGEPIQVGEELSASEIRKGILSGKITAKRSFTAGQEKKLLKQNTKPAGLHNTIMDMQATVQKGASADNPTYYDRDNIRAGFRDGVEVEDVKYLAYSNSEFSGASFHDDFMEKLSLEDITIPTYPGGKLHDVNEDGLLTKEEMAGGLPGGPTSALVVSDTDKEILFESMTLPENKDLFAEHWSEWASMKLYKSWEDGFNQRNEVQKFDKDGKLIPGPAYTTEKDNYGNEYIVGLTNTTRMASPDLKYQSSSHSDISGTNIRTN